MPRMRFQTNQLAVADHAADEKEQRIRADLIDQREGWSGSQNKYHQRAGPKESKRKERSRVLTVALKAQNERKQINRQRQNPQKRNHGDLLGHLARDR